jgi:K+-transporting ATPase c subunit
VTDIVDMLTQAPQSLDTHIKLNRQQTQLDQLTRATVTNTQLLKKMMEARK